MSLNNQDFNSDEDKTEKILPYKQLRGFVERILKGRISKNSDVEDISQDVFRRSWQWVNKHNKQLSLDEWKPLLAKITFNEVNRFYTKKVDLLAEDLSLEETSPEIQQSSASPQFIFEIAEELRGLPFRQRLAVVLYDGEILPYLKVALPDNYIAELLEISQDMLYLLESEIPLSDARIAEIIETLTRKDCKSSIRDERCKGRKLLKRRLFGK